MTQPVKEIIDKKGFIQIKYFSVKDTVKRKRKEAINRRYLQMEHLMKNCYPKYSRTLKTQ
jgi:hypothetical protein